MKKVKMLAQERQKPSPIFIYCIGNSLETIQTEMTKLGAFAGFKKPFNIADLRNTVRLALESRTHQR